MKIDTLMEIVQGKWIGKKKNGEISHFSIDTRTLNPQDVFIALKGNILDGHQFLEEAEAKKALISIVSEKPSKKFKHMGIILVSDTLEAMSKLASYQREQYNIPCIAVTGSVGKSTLKEMIACILTPDYRVLKSEGNQNNHIGLPLTLLKLNQNYDVVVTELGMNHANEIEALSKICKPNISLITNIGTAHIGNLGSKKNIYQAKMEIVKGMNQGLIIVNGNDKYLKKVKSNSDIECMKCGGKHGEIKIAKINVTKTETIFTLLYRRKKYLVRFPYPGKHYPNLMAMAILVGLQMNIDIETSIKRLQKVELLSHRLTKIELKNDITLFDDAYNASLESFLSAIDLIKKEKRPKLLIIGDILELGKHSDKIHLKLIKKINRIKHSEVWLVGEEMKKFQKQVSMGTYFESIEKMKEAILENDWKECTILVKGSNKMNLNQIVNTIKEKYEEN